MAPRRLLVLLVSSLLGACSDSGPSLPDLTADMLSFAPTQVGVGDQVSVSYTLRNLGGAGAAAFTSEVFLLPQSGPSVTLAQRSHSPLGRGQARTESFSVTIPTGTAPGTYLWGVRLDPADAIRESIETNNQPSAAALVAVLPAGSDVNLEVSAVSLSHATLLPDDVVTVSYTLANRGTAGLLVSPVMHLFLSTDQALDAGDRRIGEAQAPALQAGESRQLQAQVTVPSDAVAGNYTLLVVADGPRTLAETNENDNVAGAPLKIQAGTITGTDLVVTELSVSPANVARGGGVTVRFTLKNRGDTATRSSFFSRIHLSPSQTPTPSDSVLGTVNTTAVQPGQEVAYEESLVIPASTAPGTYFVALVVDPSNAVPEANDDNNVRVDNTGLVVTPPTQSDVWAQNVTVAGISGGATTAGSEITVDFGVQNNGPQPTGSITASVFLSTDTTGSGQTRTLGRVDIVTLESGQATTFSPRVTLPADLDNRRYFVGVVVDPDLRLNDPDRANNTAYDVTGFNVTGGSGCTEDNLEPNDSRANARAINPGPLSSLFLCSSNEDWYAVDVPVGSSIRVRMTSSDPSNPDLDLALYAPGPAGALLDSSGGDGADESVSASFVTTGGDHLIQVSGFLGASGAYELEVEVTLAGGNGVDLVPVSLTFAPAHADAGENVTAQLELRNAGQVASPDFRFELRLLPADATCPNPVSLGVFDTGPLPAGQGRVVSQAAPIPVGTCNGDYFLAAVLDPGELIDETFDNNNDLTTSTRFTVGGIGGCVDDMLEPNDNPLQARPLGPGTYPNLKACRDDDDWYEIFLDAGETIAATIDFNNSNGDLDLVLQDVDGVTLDSSTSTSADQERVSYTAGSAQRVRLRVAEYLEANQNGNGYTLTITGGAGVDLAVEDVQVAPSSQVSGEDVLVRFLVRNLLPLASAATTAEVRFVAGDGTETTAQSVNVPALGGGGPSSQVFELKFPLPMLAAGTYAVRVIVDPGDQIREASDANNIATTTGFRVVAACSPDAQEPNDSAGEARDATPSGGPLTLSGLGICLGDEDWFKVVVPAGSPQSLTAQITFDHTQGDLDLFLFGPGSSGPLTEIARSTTNTNDEEVATSGVQGATYYLRVVGFNSATNAYGLVVTLTP